MKRILLISLLFVASFTFAQSSKYKVSWTIKEAVQIPCPNSITEDEFGRKTNDNVTTAQYCTQDIRIEKQKEFDSKIESKEFYDRLIKEKDSQFQLKSQYIESVTIYY